MLLNPGRETEAREAVGQSDFLDTPTLPVGPPRTPVRDFRSDLSKTAFGGAAGGIEQRAHKGNGWMAF